ncbi:hypothetical protein Pelo_1919 [Pelomyxa schiedti]|nr:hypothetical protein Pelo_1919 [Pelomyxa schiedti]
MDDEPAPVDVAVVVAIAVLGALTAVVPGADVALHVPVVANPARHHHTRLQGVGCIRLWYLADVDDGFGYGGAVGGAGHDRHAVDVGVDAVGDGERKKPLSSDQEVSCVNSTRRAVLMGCTTWILTKETEISFETDIATSHKVTIRFTLEVKED